MHLALLVTLALAATFEPENLKGVTSMRVIVENIPGAEKVGLDPNLVQTAVEANLTRAGIKVTPMAGVLPYVYVQISVLSLPGGCVAYSTYLFLKAGASLTTTKKLILCDLWSDGILGARCKADKAEVVRTIQTSVLEETRKMVNDILAANQN